MPNTSEIIHEAESLPVEERTFHAIVAMGLTPPSLTGWGCCPNSGL